jgi:hypothetical protein
VRDQGFRRAIVKAYDHRCAICGVRIVTADGHTAVAAAHIIPWSYSHNDDPRNGLALCHLCHWTFDEGLVTLTDRYQVKTSPQLAVTSNLPGHLVTFNGRSLIGPEAVASSAQRRVSCGPLWRSCGSIVRRFTSATFTQQNGRSLSKPLAIQCH